MQGQTDRVRHRITDREGRSYFTVEKFFNFFIFLFLFFIFPNASVVTPRYNQCEIRDKASAALAIYIADIWGVIL